MSCSLAHAELRGRAIDPFQRLWALDNIMLLTLCLQNLMVRAQAVPKITVSLMPLFYFFFCSLLVRSSWFPLQLYNINRVRNTKLKTGFSKGLRDIFVLITTTLCWKLIHSCLVSIMFSLLKIFFLVRRLRYVHGSCSSKTRSLRRLPF